MSSELTFWRGKQNGMLDFDMQNLKTSGVPKPATPGLGQGKRRNQTQSEVRSEWIWSVSAKEA